MKSGQFHNNLFKNKADDAHAICVGFVRKHLNRLGRPEPHIPDEAKKHHAFFVRSFYGAYKQVNILITNCL